MHRGCHRSRARVQDGVAGESTRYSWWARCISSATGSGGGICHSSLKVRTFDAWGKQYSQKAIHSMPYGVR